MGFWIRSLRLLGLVQVWIPEDHMEKGYMKSKLLLQGVCKKFIGVKSLGLGLRNYGMGFRGSGLEFRDCSSRARVEGLGLRF